MPTPIASGTLLSKALQSLEKALDRWLGEGGRTFVRLAVAALLPLLIFGVLAGLLAAERTTRANTRGLAVQLATRSAERISLELDAQIDLAEALAASTALDRGDFGAFGTEVGRLTTLHPLWHGLEVTNAAGKPLFSTSGPAEARLGAASDQNSFQAVLKTDRPSIGGLGPAGLGPPAATLRVPVLRGGVLRYILSLAVVPDAIGAILDTAGAPAGWLGVVVDANGHILARTGDPNEKPGELASLGLLDAIAPGRTGFHDGVTRSGLRIETVTRSLPRTGGWMVAFGIPVSVLQHPVRHALLVLAAIGCGSLALAAGLASLVARDLHRRRASERDQATKQAVADRQALLRRLSLAQEEERRRLSRELHDQVGQSVTGLSLGLKALERHGSAPVAELQALRDMANDIGRDIHRAAADLRPAALDDLGLKKALAALAAGYAQPAGLRIEIQEVGDMGGLPAEVEILVYRVVQEALNNVLKHAKANSVSVVLERSRTKLRVIIEDDGIGFDPGRSPDPEAPPALGLLGMRERLDLVGGAMTIESAPATGATLFIDVPLASAEPEVGP